MIRSLHLCGTGWTVTNPDCPNVANHDRHPSGYSQHAEWAEAKLKTHEQERCPDCGLWVIWVPKQSSERSTNTPPTAAMGETPEREADDG